ncbi:hypothetical protein [Roseicyclus persicicus]|uniref:STAS domain-containing protein n=1 Tax=Roseicyclus persicicus TaxID=2650661 RepID=A0A7X6H155_9RHOB|nr:hypothetical protein [Roseibacterium persicicum]NKX46131.1 hypothetical protein [Roseibacterium persicicum]
MPVTFRIFPDHALVTVRYTGHVRFCDGQSAFCDYLEHPDRRRREKHLLDLSEVTGFDRDYARLMQMQAVKAAAFYETGGPAMLLYLAPTDVSLRLALMFQRSWDGVADLAVRVVRETEQAEDVLGLRPGALETLLQTVP